MVVQRIVVRVRSAILWALPGLGAGILALPVLLASPDQPDVWFIGPFDLSADLGRPGELEHPEVRAAIDGVLATLRGAGATIGAFARDGADARDWRSRGAQLILISSDVMLLAGSARSARPSRANGRGVRRQM